MHKKIETLCGILPKKINAISHCFTKKPILTQTILVNTAKSMDSHEIINSNLLEMFRKSAFYAMYYVLGKLMGYLCS